MALEVYFREDIAQGIAATTLIATKTAIANGTASPEHLRGILDHAQAQAVLYGIDWQDILGKIQAPLHGLPDQDATAHTKILSEPTQARLHRAT